MSEQKKPNLTSADRYCIIRQIVDYPRMSKTEINKAARITNPRAQRREDVILKPWIEENISLVFGEKIDWEIESEPLTNMRGATIKPDFVGEDSAGRCVIVEIKFKFDFPGDKDHLRSDPEKAAIGQILKYASAYMRDNPSTQKPRLFIVSIDFSEDVDAVCQFLCSKGIDLQHIAIKNILSK